jgi:hypothetical protein
MIFKITDMGDWCYEKTDIASGDVTTRSIGHAETTQGRETVYIL